MDRAPVKPPRFRYHRARSLADALAAKAAYGSEAAVLAGGQSLVPMLNFRLARPAAIIDIGMVEQLGEASVTPGALRAGAMTRQRTLEREVEARRAHGLLFQALRHVAHPVIRNRGTVGGSLAHADPAAELPAALLALNGRVRVASTRGERWIEARQLFVFHFTTSLADDEILVAAEFPSLDERSAGAVAEVSRRHGDFALAGTCAVVTAEADGRNLAAARIVHFGIAATPVRSDAAERLLAGREPSEALFRSAAQASAAQFVPDAVSDGDAGYRRQLVATVTERALAVAADQLRAEGTLR